MSKSSDLKSEKSSSSFDEGLSIRFKKAAIKLTEIGVAAGIEIQAFDSEELPLFNALDEARQNQVASELEHTCEILLDAKPSVDDLSYNRRAAWSEIKRSGFVIRSEVFENLKDEDIIEIWGADGRQIFRSFHALKFWSYTLEELLTYPFFELFERDASLETAYLVWFQKLLSGVVIETVALDIPSHVVREKRSKRKYSSVVTPKMVSPLKDKNGQVTAFFYTCSARKIEN
jgi:hypothetical protein